MQKKITWLIIILLSALAVAFWTSSYYWYSSKNKETSENQMQNEKEFLDFSDQKKKLPQKSEEVSLVAVGDISYSRGVERIVKNKKTSIIHF